MRGQRLRVPSTGDCLVDCPDACDLQCAGSGNCDFWCGPACLASCTGSGLCLVSVGDDSTVSCTGSGDCDVDCDGDCLVECPGSGSCIARCEPGFECDISSCSGSLQSCPDDILACNAACPDAAHYYDWAGGRTYLPWDLDTVMKESFDVFAGGGIGGGSGLYTDVLFSSWEGDYDAILTELLAGPLSVEAIDSELARADTVAASAFASDPFASETMAEAVSSLQTYWTQRHAAVQAMVDAH